MKSQTLCPRNMMNVQFFFSFMPVWDEKGAWEVGVSDVALRGSRCATS